MVLRGWRLILITETCLENSLHLYVYISMAYTSAISFLNNTDNQSESESEIAQSCPILWDPIDCSLPGSSIHRIFQARVLEWVAISFSRGSSRPKEQSRVCYIYLYWQAGSLPLGPPGKPKLIGWTRWNCLPFSTCPNCHPPAFPCRLPAGAWRPRVVAADLACLSLLSAGGEAGPSAGAGPAAL